ncbi:molybdopterin molybdotransferase MoeA [Thermostaphylospora chromogena]|uniref:Molybdopterin molybdenumtransferase n=1 Tax=Thermostaphylospora chromogena TaxID=35622 RepID=A0A1H1F326_9ACTN|nr:molybdopterin molybdotransferase MoeA [Thermostaphylospora chromogena]SDQ95290.1 molybdopterin molybdotransferase [Thermostaphylospora chromogena]
MPVARVSAGQAGVRGAVTPWGEARRAAADAARRLPDETVPLADAAGRLLASPLRALIPVPAFDTAAMDGYAVAGDPPWRVIGSVLAGGERMAGPLPPGTAVEIATGAEVPAGADAVLPVEGALRSGDVVRGVVRIGRHIRRRGEDCPRGRIVAAAGAAVTPALLGLAASLGHDTLTVRPRPRVAVLVTGEEVVAGGLPGPGRVRDAIGPMLPGVVSWAGGRVTGVERVGDDPRVLARALTGAASGADVVAVCGASSRGPADHLRGVLDAVGAELLVAGVACRPGHPQMLALPPGGPPVVGLPGNPFAALAAALTLLVPLVAGQAGRTVPGGSRSSIAGEVRAHPADTRLVPVRRSSRGAVPVGHDRPGSLLGAATADALAVVPPGWHGGPVELLELPA